MYRIDFVWCFLWARCSFSDVPAHRGAVHGRSDCLFTIGRYPQRLAPGVPAPPGLVNLTIVGHGAVWRMRRKDYAKAGGGGSNGWYSVSESRAALVIQGAADVTIEGLTIQVLGRVGACQHALREICAPLTPWRTLRPIRRRGATASTSTRRGAWSCAAC